MAVKTTAIIEGTVIRQTVRDLPAKGDRAAMQFVNVLVVGDNCMADARVGRDLVPPKQGEKIRARVVVDTYRDDDQITIEAYL